MTVRPISDYKNQIRTMLDKQVVEAGRKFGNEIKGYALVVWGNDADAPEVYYLKAGLTKGYLPQYIFNAMCEAFAKEEDETTIITDVGVEIDIEDA